MQRRSSGFNWVTVGGKNRLTKTVLGVAGMANSQLSENSRSNWGRADFASDCTFSIKYIDILLEMNHTNS